MPLRIGLLVIRLLENLIGADARGLDGAEAGLVERGRIDVHAADLAPPLLGGIDQARGVRNEVGVILRALAIDQNQALVAQVLQRLHLAHQLLVGERVAHRARERPAEPAILAVVAAIVAHIERREEDDAVAVDLALQRTRGLENLFHQLQALRAKQHRRLLNGQRLLAQALGNDSAHGLRVFLQTGDHRLQFRVIDKVRRVGGQCGVHVIHRCLSFARARLFLLRADVPRATMRQIPNMIQRPTPPPQAKNGAARCAAPFLENRRAVRTHRPENREQRTEAPLRGDGQSRCSARRSRPSYSSYVSYMSYRVAPRLRHGPL